MLNRFLYDRADSLLLDGSGLKPDPELTARNLERAKEVIAKMGAKWCLYQATFVCPYCGSNRTSRNGTGSDISCCGEVGHCEKMESQHQEDMQSCQSHTGEE